MRLIDADKLKAHYAWWDNEQKELFDQIVDAQPSVEVEKQKWISVEDRLPEESGWYLVFTENKHYMVLPYSKKYKVFNEFDDCAHGGFRGINCTHWMPLPEPPEEKEAEL